MRQEARNNDPRMDVVRRFIRWAWEINHDDKVPIALAGIIAPALLLGLVATYTSAWMTVVVVVLPVMFVALVRGGRQVQTARRTLEDVERELLRSPGHRSQARTSNRGD